MNRQVQYILNRKIGILELFSVKYVNQTVLREENSVHEGSD